MVCILFTQTISYAKPNKLERFFQRNTEKEIWKTPSFFCNEVYNYGSLESRRFLLRKTRRASTFQGGPAAL